MGIADRVFNIAKGYLDKATQRWDEIDSHAQRELDQYTDRSNVSAWDRAASKIAAADAARELRPQSETPIVTPAVKPPSALPSDSTIDAAYKILGIAPGSSIDTVRDAYQKLIARAAPDRFPEGSAERTEAQRIERRAGAAYMMLVESLSPADDRFDRLEI